MLHFFLKKNCCHVWKLLRFSNPRMGGRIRVMVGVILMSVLLSVPENDGSGLQRGSWDPLFLLCASRSTSNSSTCLANSKVVVWSERTRGTRPLWESMTEVMWDPEVVAEVGPHQPTTHSKESKCHAHFWCHQRRGRIWISVVSWELSYFIIASKTSSNTC